MNREQRRAFKKKHGMTIQEHAAEQLNKLSQEIDNPLHEGDLVRLDVDRITSRSDYEKTTDEYHTCRVFKGQGIYGTSISETQRWFFGGDRAGRRTALAVLVRRSDSSVKRGMTY